MNPALLCKQRIKNTGSQALLHVQNDRVNTHGYREHGNNW